MKWNERKATVTTKWKKKTQAEEANQKFIANGCVTGKISRVILTHACLLELISSSVCLDLWLRRHNIRTHTYITQSPLSRTVLATCRYFFYFFFAQEDRQRFDSNAQSKTNGDVNWIGDSVARVHTHTPTTVFGTDVTAAHSNLAPFCRRRDAIIV